MDPAAAGQAELSSASSPNHDEPPVVRFSDSESSAGTSSRYVRSGTAVANVHDGFS